MAKPFVISDPVHRYLRVAAHERIVIDHPITQRLRRITQTGLAEFVYPEARTSRFVHSLGAMHLASRFVISALENATSDDADRFFKDVKTTLDDGYTCTAEDRKVLLSEDDTSSTGGLAAVKAVFKDKRLQNNQEIRGWLGLVEAATRLAALFHDLGHLPFSHDFEFALKAHIQEQTRAGAPLDTGLIEFSSGQPHEIVGHRLADLVFKGLIKDGQQKPAVRSAYLLARKILDEKPSYVAKDPPEVNALGWLHTLIDGDIDVDRADYLLRDGRALGLEFATYNLDQLVHNLVLVWEERLGFITAVDERGFNALESYCLTRARSNQVLIRHHKVAQLGAAFRFASTEALKSKQAAPFLVELGQIAVGVEDADSAQMLLRGFAKHDDPWWTGVLRDLDPGNNNLLRASLDLVLERKQTLKSLWKRKGELSDEQRKKINGFTHLLDHAALRFVNSVPGNALAQYEEQIRELRQKHNVLLVIHNFKPYSTFPDGVRSQMMVKTGSGLMPASELSPLIRSMREAWQEDVHAHAFTLKDSPMTDAQVIEKMTIVSPPPTRSRPIPSSRRKVSVLKRNSKTGAPKPKNRGNG